MKAVIFSMDGVMFDSAPVYALGNKKMVEKLHIDVSDGYFDKYAGLTNSAMWQEIITEFNIQKELKDVLNIQLSLNLKILKEGDFSCVDGIQALVKEINFQDVPVCVVSASTNIFVKAVLKKFDIEEYVTAWVSEEEVKNRKPEADIFLKAAEVMQMKPEECLVIENTKNGIVAARKAEMRCIGFQARDSEAQDLSKADITVNKIADISVEKIISMSNKKNFKK